MWVFKFLVCMVKDHIWTGSNCRYCLRCGKLEIADDCEVVPLAESEMFTQR